MIGLLLNRYAIGAIALAMAAGGLYAYRGSLIQSGYDQAMAEVQVAQTERLREQIKETARLTGVVKGLSDVADKQKQDIAAFSDRQRIAAERLRDQEADHQRRLAAASAEAVRIYATASDLNLERCRGDVDRFAREAASCSSEAWKLKGYVDSLP